MPTVRTACAALCAAVLLFACHSKQQQSAKPDNNNSDSTSVVSVLTDEEIELQSLADSFVKSASQKFIVAKNKMTVITGKKGLRVTVNPSVLEKADGTGIDDAVEVSVLELNNVNDLLRANAATISNGKLLASGGSYFIGMQCKGQELHIKKGKFLQVDFPVLKEEEMELFYGRRDTAGNMNWLKAGVPLTAEEYKEESMFTDSNRNTDANFYPAFMYDTNGNAKIYQSTNEQVYYYENKVTISQLVDTINRHSAKIFIDTVYVWPKTSAILPVGARIDSNYLYRVYGPPKQFIIKRYKDAEEEKAVKEKERIAIQKARESWQPKTLAGQIQKYYNPTAISTLGWINCDRFYNVPENTGLQIELPITFSRPVLHYFIICKSFNGLMSGQVKADSSLKYQLSDLPGGEPVKLIAFAKENGRIYQYSKELVIQKGVVLKADFKQIPTAELQKMFGNNVRI